MQTEYFFSMRFAFLFLALATVHQSHAQTYVIDGDTLDLARSGYAAERVRLWGIDAPDGPPSAKRLARNQLRQLIGRERVVCRKPLLLPNRFRRCVKRDHSYGRPVKQCGTPSVTDLGAAMVESGYAVDWFQYSCGYHREGFHKAQTTKQGLWLSHPSVLDSLHSTRNKKPRG